jgi:hypothetical protein
VSGQLHAPVALSPGKEPPVPIGEEVGWTPAPVWKTWRSEKSSHYRDSNSDPSVVQLVASRYTDYFIPAHKLKKKFWTKTLYAFLVSQSLLLAHIYPTFLDFFILIVFVEDYKLWSSLFCNFLKSLATSSHLHPSNFLSTPFFFGCDILGITLTQSKC